MVSFDGLVRKQQTVQQEDMYGETTALYNRISNALSDIQSSTPYKTISHVKKLEMSGWMHVVLQDLRQRNHRMLFQSETTIISWIFTVTVSKTL